MTRNHKNTLAEDAKPIIGSGNFLKDRAYPSPDEARRKFLLANEIALLIEAKRLTQRDVCAVTGLKQPDVSRIVNGNVSGYSLERLLQTMTSLGGRVTVSVRTETPDHELVLTF